MDGRKKVLIAGTLAGEAFVEFIRELLNDDQAKLAQFERAAAENRVAFSGQLNSTAVRIQVAILGGAEFEQSFDHRLLDITGPRDRGEQLIAEITDPRTLN